MKKRKKNTEQIDYSDIPEITDFSKFRRVTPEETEMFRRAAERKLGISLPPRGRPTKSEDQKFTPISIRIHPKALEWAKKEAKKRGVGYQTIINEILLKAAA